MPRKPATPCSAPGGPELTRERLCQNHAKKADKNYRRFEGDPRINVRYNRAWRKIRNAYIVVHPLCEQCQKNGRLTPTQEVHHILPLSKDGTHDFNNLMALCKPCHSRISALDGNRWHSKHMYKMQLFPK